MDYNQVILQHLLEKYQPDIALITSQTSETTTTTFNRTQQAGIYNAKHRFWSSEGKRIKNNATGFICENNSNSFVPKKLFNSNQTLNIYLKIRKTPKFFKFFEEQINSFKKLFSKHKVCSL